MRDRPGPVRGDHVASTLSVDAYEAEGLRGGPRGVGGGRPYLFLAHPHGVVGVR